MKNILSYKNSIFEKKWENDEIDAKFSVNKKNVTVTLDKSFKKQIQDAIKGKNDYLLDLIDDEISMKMGKNINWDEQITLSDDGLGMNFVLESNLFESSFLPEDSVKEYELIAKSNSKVTIINPTEYQRFDKNFRFKFKISNDEWEFYYDRLAKTFYLLNTDNGSEMEITSPKKFKNLLQNL